MSSCSCASLFQKNGYVDTRSLCEPRNPSFTDCPFKEQWVYDLPVKNTKWCNIINGKSTNAELAKCVRDYLGCDRVALKRASKSLRPVHYNRVRQWLLEEDEDD